MTKPDTVLQDALRIDPVSSAAQIESTIRDVVFGGFRRKGAVVAISGGVDSAVVAMLCGRALGNERVLGLMLPESGSSPESLRLGHMLASAARIRAQVEDITPILTAAGCYRRCEEAIRGVIPEYRDGFRFKILLPNLLEDDTYPIFSVVVQFPDGSQKKCRLTYATYPGLVAAMNFKQRTRKMLEYYYADLYNYAVVGTPNLLEYDQGFFVKNGDGAADLKPIAHLYKSQVYQLAAYLGVPEEIQARAPTTDTYPLEQSQEEFYFSLSLEKMDFCLYGKNQGISPENLASALGMKEEQVRRVYNIIDSKRRAARYLHAAAALVEPREEVGSTPVGCVMGRA